MRDRSEDGVWFRMSHLSLKTLSALLLSESLCGVPVGCIGGGRNTGTMGKGSGEWKNNTLSESTVVEGSGECPFGSSHLTICSMI